MLVHKIYEYFNILQIIIIMLYLGVWSVGTLIYNLYIRLGALE